MLCVIEVLTHDTQIYALSEHPVREFELRVITFWEMDIRAFCNLSVCFAIFVIFVFISLLLVWRRS
jgi:hypothetical protein